MRKTFLLLWLVPVLAYSQLTVTGGSSIDLDTLLPIIADSSKWTAGSTVNAIKPKGAKTVEADSVKAGSLEVTGNARFNGNVTMVTTAGEQVQLGPGSDAAPELSSAGDTNTGIRFPGGDKMQLVQGGLNSHTFLPYRYTMTYSDGDTLGVWLDGTRVYFSTNATYRINAGSIGYNFSSLGTTGFWPTTSDAVTIGTSAYRWKHFYCSDNIYLGGKGQTARLLISGENTIAGTDSSWDINATGGVPTATAYHTGTFSNGGRRTYFGADTLALFNGARTGMDSSWAALVNGNVLNNGIVTIKRAVSLADAGEYTPQIPSGMCGWGSVQIGDDVEWARFRFKTDGTVTLEANSTNVGTTNDVDAKLNIYDAGTSGIIIENQLGSTLTAAMVIECYTP